MDGRCGFAFPGTYGHECGKPAEWAGQHKSEHTANGVYWAARCTECTRHRGGDNDGIASRQLCAPSIQVCAWRQNNWPDAPTVKYAPA